MRNEPNTVPTRPAALAVLVALAALLAVAFTPFAQPADAGPPDLQDVRKATARFHSITQVERAGYSDAVVPGCFDTAGAGMGLHYINASLLDDTIDPLQPEAIVYEVGEDGRLTLVGVEYVAPPVGAYELEPPTLFGQTFTMHPTLGVWKLHAWIWRANPTGMFEDFNPSVDACP